MRLISVTLSNIRSYREVQVNFDTGTTLLSGDIGSGKSTLLIAVEFALFGLSRGELTGAALLRHGEDLGMATIEFEADSVLYAVSRSLKRTKNGIVQDHGWLEIVGQRESLTPTEIRARIYEILGYPLQFLAKRNLLYRFTLYTPQEEMKAILTQSPEERIEAIRRIFGVDAYKIVRDNAQLLTKELKSRAAVHEELMQRIVHDKELLNEKLKREQELKTQLGRFAKEKEMLNERLSKEEKQLTEVERNRSALQNKRQLHAMHVRNIQVFTDEIARFTALKREKEQRIEKVRTGLQSMAGKLHEMVDIAALQQELESTQHTVGELKENRGKLGSMLEQCALPNIAAGTACPVCQQEVTGEHIETLHSSLEAKRQAVERKQVKLAEQLSVKKEEIDVLTKKVETARQMAELKRRQADQQQALQEHEADVAKLSKLIAEKEKARSEIPDENNEHLVKEWKEIEEKYSESHRNVTAVRSQILDVEKRLAALTQEKQTIAEAKKQLQKLDEELLEREQKKMRATHVKGWLADQFSPFTSVVERHILSAIHTTFDAAFRSWFTRLMDDDALNVRLSQEFTPLMEQNGYEMDIAHLSGGERTAVALAYRLALVHTIHALLPHLGTAGLIMLDEPTDGFSSEQLARMRDVLDELAMEQIIIVSHEQQLEGFVDHILRVQKNGDSSTVST